MTTIILYTTRISAVSDMAVTYGHQYQEHALPDI